MFLGPIFWYELIFSLIVIVTCGLIYLKTKELYDLSSYKGIKYFGNAFLFFGIAFLARLILRFFPIFGISNPPGFIFFNLGYLIFLYSGLMAGFFLIYSSLWKHLKNPEQIGFIFHPIAITIAAVFIIFLFGPATLTLLAVIFLLAAVLSYSSSSEKSSKKKDGIARIHVLYILLFFAFIANGAAQFFIRISDQTSIILYSISSILFLIILYRVIKSTQK